MSAGKGDRNRSDNARYWRSNYWKKQEEAKQLTNDRVRPAKKGGKIKSEDCKEADNN